VAKRRPDAKPRPRLDLDLIIQTAVELLDDHGLDGLTTRALATRLGVRSPALYWYVHNKDELLDLVADAICAPVLESDAIPTTSADLGWRARLEADMRAYRVILHSHRDATRLLADRPPVGPIRRRLADAAVGHVLDAGFPDADAALIALVISDYVISLVSDEIRLRTRPAPTVSEDTRGDAEQYPNLARIAPHLATAHPDALFEVGLGVLLDGIQRRLENTRPAAAEPDATASMT
jgi:TetR/AcrR family transcriptional regulator, tetracycline repressor protein